MAVLNAQTAIGSASSRARRRERGCGTGCPGVFRVLVLDCLSNAGRDCGGGLVLRRLSSHRLLGRNGLVCIRLHSSLAWVYSVSTVDVLVMVASAVVRDIRQSAYNGMLILLGGAMCWMLGTQAWRDDNLLVAYARNGTYAVGISRICMSCRCRLLCHRGGIVVGAGVDQEVRWGGAAYGLQWCLFRDGSCLEVAFVAEWCLFCDGVRYGMAEHVDLTMKFVQPMAFVVVVAWCACHAPRIFPMFVSLRGFVVVMGGRRWCHLRVDTPLLANERQRWW